MCSNSDHVQWIEYDRRYLQANPLLEELAIDTTFIKVPFLAS